LTQKKKKKSVVDPNNINNDLVQDSISSLLLSIPTIPRFIFLFHFFVLMAIYLLIYLFTDLFIFLFICIFCNQKGALDSNEQTILGNFYGPLTYRSFTWDLSIDLCGQTGVVCDSSNPQRITQLYFYFFFANKSYMIDYFKNSSK